MATQHLTQQELLDSYQENAARFQKLMLQLSEEEQQTAFTPQGWSAKDFLAHMSHWKAATHTRLVAYVHDQPLPPTVPSGDEANAEVQATDKELSLPQVRNDWEEIQMHMIHLIADELNDKRLQEETLPPWSDDDPMPVCEIVADMCEHDAEHLELIEQYFEIDKR